MSPPKVKFDKEAVRLTLSDFGAGYTLRDLATIRLFDTAQVDFPTSWSQFKVRASTHILETTWRLNSTWFIEQTLKAGGQYTLKDGAGGSMSFDNELIGHLLDRPLVKMDALMTFKLEGSADRDGFDGSGSLNLGLRLKF